MKKKCLLIIFGLLITVLINTISAQGYLHAKGKNILDGSGKVFLLKGMGLGGWMIQEPYMMLASGNASAGQHSIFSDIESLIGLENLETYHKAWLNNYITEADVAEIKASGFNSIRLPMHYNLFTLPIDKEPIIGRDTWLSIGFDLTDKVLNWCKKYEVFLILDCHAAPGAQGLDSNISDYDSTKLSLWESPENQRKSIALWAKLAQRYANESWIGGYDLLNETNWSFGGENAFGCYDTINAPLKEFYEQTIAEIRKVDRNHLIFIEGNCYATNHLGLWPINDSNVALSFHKYWNDNVIEAIQRYIDMSNQYNVPLWMGESGENNNKWFADEIALLESNNIGWAWWTWKKMNSKSSSYSILAPAGYQDLLNYWTYGGNPPDSIISFDIMMNVAKAALLENCTRNSEAIDALTKEKPTCDQLTHLSISSRLEGINYCQMFGIQTEACSDIGGGYNISWIDKNDWLAYNVTILDSAKYFVKYRVASFEGGGKIQLESFGGKSIYGAVDIPKTGGWQSWTTVSQVVFLKAGNQTLGVNVKTGGFNLNWIEISKIDTILNSRMSDVSVSAFFKVTE